MRGSALFRKVFVGDFSRQQVKSGLHPKILMFKRNPLIKLNVIVLVFITLFLSGCKNPFSPKSKQQTATLLETDTATRAELLDQINYFAGVESMRAKMYLKFEDNSYARSGLAEKYKTADGEIVVQRPANILLKVKVPIIKTDVAQMASNGRRFCVAILQDGGSGDYKKFVCGTNDTDYSRLQRNLVEAGTAGSPEELKKNVNAFANLRPQHFTEAVLVRPVDTGQYAYAMSTIVQEEVDFKLWKKKSPLGWVLRGYYLIDEFRRGDDGSLSIARRFWFDRVGGINLARQQIFDAEGEIETDIVYGKRGRLTADGDYNLPLQLEVTRPKEKYKMRLTYQTPEEVMIGRTFPEEAFVLENSWDLEELDLDRKLRELLEQDKAQGTGTPVRTQK